MLIILTDDPLLHGEFGPRLCAFQPFLVTLLLNFMKGLQRGELQTLPLKIYLHRNDQDCRFSRVGARSMCAWHLELGEKAGIGNALVPALLHPGPSAALLTLSWLRHYLEVTEGENGTRELISLAQHLLFNDSGLTEFTVSVSMQIAMQLQTFSIQFEMCFEIEP